jgi:Holliday junction resolvasome RuvABC ATP-dependent DNA helicase subunit
MKSKKFWLLPENCRRMACKRTTPWWRSYIGQEEAVDKLLDIQFQAWSNEEHMVAENIMFTGPPSVGKTALVKVFANEILTPLLMTDANQLSSGVIIGGKKISGGPDTLIHLIHETWAKQGEYGPLEGRKSGNIAYYKLPPMMIFIDEIHGLGRKSADALLKATERADAQLLGKSSIMDCSKVMWIGATTDWGKLPSAFRTRFNQIALQPPSPEDVAKIVKVNNKDWDMNLCERVVFYGSTVPREALGFARVLSRYAERAGKSPIDCIQACAEREGIDKFGMRKQRLDILRALNQAPEGLILRNLSAAVSLETDEVVKHWLPGLMFNKPQLVQTEQSRYIITEAGKAELFKRR